MFCAYNIFTILYFMLYDKGVARGLIVVVPTIDRVCLCFFWKGEVFKDYSFQYIQYIAYAILHFGTFSFLLSM